MIDQNILNKLENINNMFEEVVKDLKQIEHNLKTDIQLTDEEREQLTDILDNKIHVCYEICIQKLGL